MDLLDITKGKPLSRTVIQAMFDNGDFDSFKGTRTLTAIVHKVNAQSHGRSMPSAEAVTEMQNAGVQQTNMRKMDDSVDSQKEQTPNVGTHVHRKKKQNEETKKRKIDTRVNHKKKIQGQVEEAGAGPTGPNPGWRRIGTQSTGSLVDDARADSRARAAGFQQTLMQPSHTAETSLFTAFFGAADMLMSMQYTGFDASVDSTSRSSLDDMFTSSLDDDSIIASLASDMAKTSNNGKSSADDEELEFDEEDDDEVDYTAWLNMSIRMSDVSRSEDMSDLDSDMEAFASQVMLKQNSVTPVLRHVPPPLPPPPAPLTAAVVPLPAPFTQVELDYPLHQPMHQPIAHAGPLRQPTMQQTEEDIEIVRTFPHMFSVSVIERFWNTAFNKK